MESGLAELLTRLGRQSFPLERLAELVVTHDGLPAEAIARLAVRAGRRLTPVELPPGSGYYEHKNRGFEATTGEVVAFTDGDCAPCPGWLEALTDPIVRGEARVVAGSTRYPSGPAALAATAMDFPIVVNRDAPVSLRHFFANNVAFAREVFAARRGYPEAPRMFHGQCQMLALALQRDGTIIRFAPGASIEHAWPEGAREKLKTRLLKGADARSLVPHLARAYAPRLGRPIAHLGPLPALALLGARAVRAGGGGGALARARPPPRPAPPGAPPPPRPGSGS